MSANIRLIHHTKNRARFLCDILKHDLNLIHFEQELKSIDGVSSVRINKLANSIVFEYSETNTLELIQNKLESFDINQFQVCDDLSFKHQTCTPCVGEEEPSTKGVLRAGLALVTEPFIQNDTAKLALSTVAALPMLQNGIKELYTEGLTSAVLESMAVGVSLARKDYMAANGTNAMLELGEYIEETTVHKSDDLIRELAKPNVKEAWIEIDEDGRKELKKVKTATIKVGEIVVIGAGDTIAIDGHIVSGTASVNQVSMTGESEAVKKERGDRVISGTVVEEGRIKVWAESVGEDTATARIKNYISTTLSEKSSVGLKATKLADKLVPVTLGLAGFSYVLSRDMETVASVLQADYSCALKLATPVAFKTSIAKAGKNGIMIKGAKSLESLYEADTFVFDKTGTLTYGELEVEKITSFNDDWTEDKLLNLTASAEEHYFHPVAEAIVNAAKAKGFVHMHHEEVEFIVAHGVKTVVDKKEVIIGSRHFLEDDKGVDFSAHEEAIQLCLPDKRTLLYIAYDNKLLGTISMRDRVRENAKAMLLKLKSLGVKKTVMLTGDTKSKAELLAKELGIDEVYAELKPTEKSSIINDLKASGAKVAFIGDGINDAPALMSAHVGISMSRGADIAKATADVGLLKDDIEAISEVKELAVKTMGLINGNFNATVGINSIILLGATFGLFKPLTTAVLHNGTTIGLLAKSMKGV
jgi:heavy metal translocating P-type ATPase